MRITSIFILALSYLLSSCDNRENFLREANLPPKLELINSVGGPATTDSVKLTLKSIKKFVEYKFTVSGNKVDKIVFIKTVNGSGTLTTAGITGDGERTVPNGTYSILYTPSAPGKTLIHLEAKDSFKNIKEAQVEVVAFQNLDPSANLILNNIAILDPKEYEFDASGSYDRDRKFGGGISSYEFKIGTKKVLTNQPKVKWIFNSSGNYEIGVTVKDADGGSDTFTKIININ